MCEARLSRISFDIVLGAFAAFLCEKHYKKVMRFLESK